jgi:putative ABC transport system substrate-binding protein
MRRREFIAGLGATAWPLAARAQQPAMPVVGYLHIEAADTSPIDVAAFRKGLGEAGYVDGRNVMIEFRWADGRFERMSALAADLIRRQPAVIFAYSRPAAQAVRAASRTIPIVFFIGEDPVKEGLVESLNRPGGSITGFSFFSNQMHGKRLTLLRDAVSKPVLVAFHVVAGPEAQPLKGMLERHGSGAAEARPDNIQRHR